MKIRLIAFCALVVALAATVRAVAAEVETFEWKAGEASALGLSAEKLEVLRKGLAERGTKALLVIRRDRVAVEWYAPDFSAEKAHYTASMAKGIVGGLSLAVAMQDGRIRAEDPASKYIWQWKDDPRKSKITIAQLATHSSGVEDAEDEKKTPHERLTGWKGNFWKRRPDPFTISRDLAPVVDNPGEKVRYSNPGMAMLAYAVTAAISDGEHKDIRTLLRERIYEPIGIEAKQWNIGYGQSYRADGLDLVANWGGGSFVPRATARVGRLMLREGEWDGKRVLDAAVIRACIDGPGGAEARQWEGAGSPRPGFGWWTNRDKAWKSAPRDAYVAAGAGHQILLVIPSLEMIVVRNGSQIEPKETFWAALEKHLLSPLMEAVIDPPYRASDVIRKVRFDPPSTIVRKAIDSDNWPIAWGDDGRLYTSYGDGRGFEPLVERKLSLGLARIEGEPPDFRGVNVRSESAERVGDGAKGAKASGMLMVDGVLYMWVRNTGNSTLAWSADRGATWTWGFTFDTSFGCPTFLNFGRNYAGAPDEYVYVYSQDGPSAYEPYDGVVLARVQKRRIRDKDACEFFQRLDDGGQPVWTRDISARGHVFRYAGHCERLDAVYHPALKRYLLAVGFGHGKGWGIFDAPRPWGPWTTAFYTPQWDIPETHGYRLPSKWISGDGRTMWLVFSGRRGAGLHYDAFCARRMTLELYPSLVP